MSQDDIAISFIKRVVKVFPRPLSVFSQLCHIAKRLDPVFITSTASSPFDQIDDIDMGPSNSLFAQSARIFRAANRGHVLPRIDDMSVEAARRRWHDTGRATQLDHPLRRTIGAALLLMPLGNDPRHQLTQRLHVASFGELASEHMK